MIRTPRLSSEQTLLNYDGAGSVVSITETLPIYTGRIKRPSFGTSTSFAYDSASRPTAVRRTSGWSTTTASMKWDVGGSLAEIDVRDDDSGAAPPTFSERRYGPLFSERYVADDGGGYQIVRAIPGPIGVIAQLRTSEDETSGIAKTEVLYQHGDQRGARLVTDESGAEAQVLDYAAYGRVSTDTGTAGSFDYTATQWNHGTTLTDLGLVQLGPRLYQPTTGRFLQRDPIIHVGGASASNPYSFAFDDPVNFSDPSGLSPVTLCISNGPTGTGNCSGSVRASITGAGGMSGQIGLFVGINLAITAMNYLTQAETNYASFGDQAAYDDLGERFYPRIIEKLTMGEIQAHYADWIAEAADEQELQHRWETTQREIHAFMVMQVDSYPQRWNDAQVMFALSIPAGGAVGSVAVRYPTALWIADMATAETEGEAGCAAMGYGGGAVFGGIRRAGVRSGARGARSAARGGAGEIALGRDIPGGGYKALAEKTGASRWQNWARDGITRRSPQRFGRAFSHATRRAKRIHYSLDGIADPVAWANRGRAGFVDGKLYSAAELYIIKNDPALLAKTIFYRNGVVVPSPF